MNSFYKNSQTIYEVIRIPLNKLRPLNFIDNNKNPKLIEEFFQVYSILKFLLTFYPAICRVVRPYLKNTAEAKKLGGVRAAHKSKIGEG